MAVFPILKKRVMTPKIPQPQYRLAASISIKGRQVESRGRPTRRGCSPAAASAATAATGRLLPLQPRLSRPAGFKRPRWDWNQSKNNILPKKTPSPDTWLCQIRSIIVSIRYIQCDMGQNTANIYSQSTVEVQSNNRKLLFLCNVASTV